MNSILLTTMRSCSRRSLYTVATSSINNQAPSVAGCNHQCTNLLGYQFNQQFIIKRSKSTTPFTSDEKTEEVLNNLNKRLHRQKRLLEEPDDTTPQQIYVGPLTRQVKTLKLFSLTTSGMGLMMQPILIQKASEIPMAANIAAFGMVGFFTFVTPFLIHLMAKKYVTEIMYDPRQDKYAATTYNLFLVKNQIVFRAEDVKVPEVPGPFTTLTVNTNDGSSNNKCVPLFIAPESFLKPSHYGRFMGYDKPIDLHLNVESTDDNQSSSSEKSSSNARK